MARSTAAGQLGCWARRLGTAAGLLAASAHTPQLALTPLDLLTRNTPQAITWAASAPEIPAPIQSLVKDASAAAAGAEPFPALTQRLGVSCAMPGAIQCALAAAQRAGGDYAAGVRMNMTAGEYFLFALLSL